MDLPDIRRLGEKYRFTGHFTDDELTSITDQIAAVGLSATARAFGEGFQHTPSYVTVEPLAALASVPRTNVRYMGPLA